MVGVAHEALLREWPRVSGWIDERFILPEDRKALLQRGAEEWDYAMAK